MIWCYFVSKCVRLQMLLCFFFNDTATTEIYTLSLHDALPICGRSPSQQKAAASVVRPGASSGPSMASFKLMRHLTVDRKSTRLNSSHANISYAVFCLKKKKNKNSLPSLGKLY